MAMSGCLLLAKVEREIGNNWGFRSHPRMLQVVVVLEMEASHLQLDEREKQFLPPSSDSRCSKGCFEIQLGQPHGHSYPPKMVSWWTV